MDGESADCSAAPRRSIVLRPCQEVLTMITNDKSSGNARSMLTEEQLRAAQRVAEAHAARVTAAADRVARQTVPNGEHATSTEGENAQVLH
jgi:hypothetical protein